MMPIMMTRRTAISLFAAALVVVIAFGIYFLWPTSSGDKAVSYVKDNTQQSAYLADDSGIRSDLANACKEIGNHGIQSAIDDLKDKVYAEYPDVDRGTAENALDENYYYAGGPELVLSELEIHDQAVLMYAAVKWVCPAQSRAEAQLQDTMDRYDTLKN